MKLIKYEILYQKILLITYFSIYYYCKGIIFLCINVSGLTSFRTPVPDEGVLQKIEPIQIIFYALLFQVWEPLFLQEAPPRRSTRLRRNCQTGSQHPLRVALVAFQDLFINYCHICLFLATVTITRGNTDDSISRLSMVKFDVVSAGKQWLGHWDEVKLLHSGCLGWEAAKE